MLTTSLPNSAHWRIIRTKKAQEFLPAPILDTLRESDPSWYTFNRFVGATRYVDRFAVDIQVLREPFAVRLSLTSIIDV